MKLDFFPVDVDYVTDHRGRAVIRLFGRTVDGKGVCVFDEDFDPYFWVVFEDKSDEKNLTELIRKLKVKDEKKLSFVIDVKKEDKNHLGKKVSALKVFVNHPSDVNVIKSELKKLKGVKECLEVDILFYRRYLIDKGFSPLIACTVEGEEVESDIKVDYCINAKNIIQTSNEILKNPRILAFDIEVYNKLRTPNDEKDPIVMLSFYGQDLERVITWKKFEGAKKYVEFVKDEGELLLRFKDIIQEYKPDYLVGYYSDGFDFPYLRARADKYKIKLNIGLDRSNIRFSRRSANKTAKVKGFAHIDIFKFIRRVMKDTLDVDNYNLDSVSRALLGEGKREEFSVEDLHVAWDQDHDKLKDYAEYNLLDSKLAYRLTQLMVPHLNELVKLVGLPIDDLSRMTYGQLVEWYMLRHMKDFNEISNNRPIYDEISRRNFDTYEGAFVYQPDPGIYKNIMVFDFKSLYPTIIVDHNICSSTITESTKNVHVSPVVINNKKETKFYFIKQEGIVPHLLREILERRNRVKKMMKGHKKDPVLEARQYGLKILANSFYGYFGFSGARWYCNECAATITAYARDYIKKTIEKAKKDGFKIIYGDTDSLFITLENKTKKDAEKFLKDVNKNLPGERLLSTLCLIAKSNSGKRCISSIAICLELRFLINATGSS